MNERKRRRDDDEPMVPLISRLKDDELDREFEHKVVEIIKSNPGMVIRMLRDLGWQVIPPDDSDE
jgi:hypothetical protein